MLDCMLEEDCVESRFDEIEENFFATYLLPLHLKEKKYIQMAIDDDLTFDEVVEAIYANEYESYLQGRVDSFYEGMDNSDAR